MRASTGGLIDDANGIGSQSSQCDGPSAASGNAVLESPLWPRPRLMRTRRHQRQPQVYYRAARPQDCTDYTEARAGSGVRQSPYRKACQI
jgi:hypothetical protein